MTEDQALTPEQEGRVQAAEYTLRLMSPAEEVAFEARLAEDPALTQTVTEWVDHFAPLADEYAPAKPPKAVKAKVLAELFGPPEAPASVWSRLGLWQGLTVLATAAAAFMAVMLVTQTPQPIPQPNPQTPTSGPLFVSEIIAADNSLRVLAVYDGATGDLRVTRTAGGPDTGRDFELWAIVGENAPRSLGVLDDGGTGSIVIPADLKAAISGMVLAISDEPDGGSTTGAPTGAVLAVGKVTDI